MNNNEADAYASGYENGHADGYLAGYKAAYDKALAEWCDVSTAEPYTTVTTPDRPQQTFTGSGRRLVTDAKASWDEVQRRIAGRSRAA